MLNITHHQGHTNQNYDEIPPHTVKMAKINNIGNSALTLLVGMQSGTATLENRMEALQKVKNRTTLGSSNCTTRYLPKRRKNTDSKGHMHTNIYSSTIHSSQAMEKAQMSTD